MSAGNTPDTQAPEQSKLREPGTENAENVETKPKKQDLPIGVVLGVLVAVFAVIGYIGYTVVLAPPPLKADERERLEYINALAKKSGGDLSKLTKEELDKADALTRGFGKVSIRDVAEAKGYNKP
ncbi:MAG: hypothetical protein SFU56_06535 [Capsulimonadales bacterium]|nr:hypothetical protein [Capsulimonadales bacterium]